MQAAAAHIASGAKVTASPGGSDPFGSFSFVPANDPTASAAPTTSSSSGSSKSVADSFAQALAAMMGVTASANFAPQTSTTAVTSQTVAVVTTGAKGVQAPPPPPLAADETAADEAAANGAEAKTTTLTTQVSANALAAKAQTPQPQNPAPSSGQAPQALGATPGAGQTQAAALTAFRASVNQAANDGPSAPPPAITTPAPALNAQLAQVAILTGPTQTAPTKTGSIAASTDKTQTKANETEDTPTSGAAVAQQKPQAPTPAANTAPGEDDADLDGHRPSETEAAPQTAATQTASAPDNSSFASALAQSPATAQTAAVSTALAASAGATVASQIADQTIKNLTAKSTRFDVALEPAGLGQVNVKIQIDQTGQVSAAFSFDNAHAAAAAKSQAGQLQQALEQAGFNVSQGGLSFDVGGQGAGGAQLGQNTSSGSGGGQTTSEPTPAIAALEASSAASTQSLRASGVDITV